MSGVDSQKQNLGLESLSALMDDEADDLEARRILRALESESEDADELVGAWSRLHVARAALAGDTIVAPATTAAILAAIDDEPALSESSDADQDEQDQPQVVAPSRSRLWRQVGGLGLAASVALAAVLIGQNSTSDPEAAPALASGKTQGQVDAFSRQNGLQPAVYRMPVVTQAPPKRTRSYMLHHAQQTGVSQHAPGVGLVRVAAYRAL